MEFRGVWSDDETEQPRWSQKWKIGDIAYGVHPPREEIDRTKVTWIPHHLKGESIDSLAHNWILVAAAPLPVGRKAPPEHRVPRLGQAKFTSIAKRNAEVLKSKEALPKKVTRHPVYGDYAVNASAALSSDAAASSSSASAERIEPGVSDPVLEPGPAADIGSGDDAPDVPLALQALHEHKGLFTSSEYNIMHDVVVEMCPDQLDVMMAAHGDDMDLDMGDERPPPT